MQILIHPRTMTADEELRERTAATLEAALAPVRSSVHRVDAYLTDVNGPRGGPDKRCRVVARLSTGPVVVSRTRTDPIAAVEAAAAVCRRSVRASLKRRQHRRRRTGAGFV